MRWTCTAEVSQPFPQAVDNGHYRPRSPLRDLSMLATHMRFREVPTMFFFNPRDGRVLLMVARQGDLCVTGG